MSVKRADNVVGARIVLEGTIGDLLEKYPNLVHITSDGSDYVDRCSERRFDVGIAEANLINVATGFALKNHKVIVNGIASFVLYNALLQIRNNISHHDLGVIIIGVGAGLSYGHLGATHHALEDIACLYTLPNINIYLPVDGLEAASMLQRAVSIGEPAYIRIRTGQEPVISDREEYENTSDYDHPIILGATGESRILIICYGATVAHSLHAAQRLREQGLSITVLSVRTLSRTSINKIVFQIKKFKHVIVVEEHYDETGVGAILSRETDAPLIIIGVKKEVEHLGGSPDELLAHSGLDADSIIRKIMDVSKDNLR